MITNLLPSKFYLRNHPYPHLHACKYILAVNICLAPLLYIGLTCNIFFWAQGMSRNTGCCVDVLSMIFNSTCSDPQPFPTNILPPKPPASSTCGRQDYSWCHHTSIGPVLYRGVACKVACAVCKLFKPSLCLVSRMCKKVSSHVFNIA